MEGNKTYCKKEKGYCIDWNQVLSIPENKITDDMWEQMRRNSQDWVTCACGNQCSIIPRDEFGAPLDFTLRYHGKDFYTSINQRNIEEAKIHLKRIEEISSKIIQEITNGNK